MTPGEVADAACRIVDELRAWPAREAAGCADSSPVIQALEVDQTDTGGVLRCTLAGGAVCTIRWREVWERLASGDRRRLWVRVPLPDGTVGLDAELLGPLPVFRDGPWVRDLMRLDAAVDDVRRVRQARDPYGFDDIMMWASRDADGDDGDGE